MRRTAWCTLGAILVAMLAALGTPVPSSAATPTPCAELEIVAHRGMHERGVDQNTVQAFTMAARNGFSIETDVWVDAEGVLWVFHDRNTFKATGTEGLIDEMTTAQVRQLRYRKAGSALVTLVDALDALAYYPDTTLYLQPKAGYLADDVADMVIAKNRVETTWLTNFTARIQESHPAIQVLETVSGSLPADPGPYVERGVDIVSTSSLRLHPSGVDRFHAVGIGVQGGNRRTTLAWRQAIKAGADGQLTDDPAGLRQFCPAALASPRINARKSERTSRRSMVVRGNFFYDVSMVRVARKKARFDVVSPGRIEVRSRAVRAKKVKVVVRNPNGTVRRTVRLGPLR